MPRDLVVPPDSLPVRLDQFVAASVPGASRRRLRAVELRLNGHAAKHGVAVRPGDVVSVPDSILENAELAANPSLELPVLYADAAVVAVDKRAGLASVALRPDERDTVANFLLAAFPETRGAGSPLEAGLVHRLDQETSGVLLAARTASAYADLRRQFSQHQVEKDYLAVASGDVAEPGRIDTPIAHDPRQAARMLACADAARAERLGARPASSRYQPVVRYGQATLLKVTMRTGVRHQVRVHLATLGHPILGDRLYAETTRLWSERQALHATCVRLRHPESGAALVVESPLPADLEVALRRLRRR